MPSEPRIVVIGAGLAGLTAADALRRAGVDPLVLEKSRGIGGRLATRRTREGLDFDHGSPAVNALGEPFASFLAHALQEGRAAPWRREIVGAPGMSALPIGLAQGLEIRFETEVAAVEPAEPGLRVRLTDGAAIPATLAIVTAPAPQTARLCAAFPRIVETAGMARMTPCWSLMAAFATPLPGPDLRPGAGPIAGAHRISAKPGRAAGPDRWVAEATPEWSAARLEQGREETAPQLLAAFLDLVGADQAPVHVAAHRWRHARTAQAVGRMQAREGPVIAAGDWMLGPDAGHAYESGLAAVRAALEGGGAL
jgi:predicted NAD/FAD-dependent oxidoreductase